MNWLDEHIDTVICGDSLKIMATIPDKCVQLSLTGPPYGIGMSEGFEGFEGFGGFGKPIKRRQYPDEWDMQRPKIDYFNHILRLAKKVLIFGGNHFADMLPLGHHWIVWDKLNTMPTFGDCELIWANIERKSVKKIVLEYNGLLGKEDKRYHPTQKPEQLCSKLILEYSNEGDVIIDPFLGSGTTAVACINTDRHFIGIEISPEYCAIAERRIAEAREEKKIRDRQIEFDIHKPKQMKPEQIMFNLAAGG